MLSLSRKSGNGAKSGKDRLFSVQEMVAEVERERHEQYAAQIAAMSCEVSLSAIQAGVKKTVYSLRRIQRSKYDYNLVRKRDFHIGKPPVPEKASIDELFIDLERFGKASYQSLQTDPIPFIRNFKNAVYEDALRLINRKFTSFDNLRKIDFSNQELGDDKFISMCLQISRAPIVQLNVAGNKLTDVGMNALSGIQRSLHYLESLNISNNNISDAGIAMLLDEDTYSGAIQSLNVSCNELGVKTAFYICSMFQKQRHSQLHTLILGGRVGKRGWGDLFVRVLVSGIIQTCDGEGLKKLKRLTLSDAGLTHGGIDSLAALLLCEGLELNHLNIAKNRIGGASGGSTGSNSTYRTFLTALRLNSSLRELHITECGLTKLERTLALETVRYNDEVAKGILHQRAHFPHAGKYSNVGWDQRHIVAYKVASSLNACHLAYKDVYFDIMRALKPGDPLPVWKIEKSKYDPDILGTFATAFNLTLDHLPAGAYDTLNSVNNQLVFIQQLHDATLLARMMSIDSSNLKFSENGAANKAKAKAIRDMLKDIKLKLRKADALLKRRTEAAELTKNNLFSMLNNYCVNRIKAVEALSANGGRWAAKRAAAKLLSSSSHTQSAALEKANMAAEDYFSAIQEQGEVYQQVIGEHYRHRLLHFCLLQEHLASGKGGERGLAAAASSSSSSSSSGVVSRRHRNILGDVGSIPTSASGESRRNQSSSSPEGNKKSPSSLHDDTDRSAFQTTFSEFLKKSMPYYKHLTTAGAFVYYYYLVYPKEKTDKAKREEKMMQQLALKQQKDQHRPGTSASENCLISTGQNTINNNASKNARRGGGLLHDQLTDLYQGALATGNGNDNNPNASVELVSIGEEGREEKEENKKKKKAKAPPPVRLNKDGTLRRDLRSASFRFHDREAMRFAAKQEAIATAAAEEVRAKATEAAARLEAAERAEEEEDIKLQELIAAAGAGAGTTSGRCSEDRSEEEDSDGEEKEPFSDSSCPTDDRDDDDDEFSLDPTKDIPQQSNDGTLEEGQNGGGELQRFMQVKKELQKRISSLRSNDLKGSANNTTIVRARTNRNKVVLPQPVFGSCIGPTPPLGSLCRQKISKTYPLSKNTKENPQSQSPITIQLVNENNDEDKDKANSLLLRRQSLSVSSLYVDSRSTVDGEGSREKSVNTLLKYEIEIDRSQSLSTNLDNFNMAAKNGIKFDYKLREREYTQGKMQEKRIMDFTR